MDNQKDFKQFNFVGKNVIVMTGTTHYWMGKCVHEDIFHYYLTHSCWIAFVGRHNEVMNSGKMCRDTECEPHPDDMVWAVPRQGTTIGIWNFPLWRTVNPKGNKS